MKFYIFDETLGIEKYKKFHYLKVLKYYRFYAEMNTSFDSMQSLLIILFHISHQHSMIAIYKRDGKFISLVGAMKIKHNQL